MSTIDPDARSRQRAEHRHPQRSIAVWRLVVVLGGALIGYGAPVFATQANLDDAGWPSGMRLCAWVIGINFCAVGCTLLLRAEARAHVPAGRGLLVWGGVCLGVGIGMIGAAVDLLARSLVPTLMIILLVAGPLIAIAGALMMRSATMWKRAAERARQTGLQTQGVITHVAFTGTTVNSNPRAKFTVRFTDQQGVERFVRRAITVSILGGPSEGDQTTLWYDPQHPANEKSIYVDLFA